MPLERERRSALARESSSILLKIVLDCFRGIDDQPFFVDAFDGGDVFPAVFSQKVLGEGTALLPENGLILSPCTGVVSNVADTLHAYGITTDDGLEILVHIGIDTVQLNGQGFESLIQEGARVKAAVGRLLLHHNRKSPDGQLFLQKPHDYRGYVPNRENGIRSAYKLHLLWRSGSGG